MSTPASPTLLLPVRAHDGDRDLYVRLAAQGYRLLGYPRALAAWWQQLVPAMLPVPEDPPSTDQPRPAAPGRRWRQLVSAGLARWDPLERLPTAMGQSVPRSLRGALRDALAVHAEQMLPVAAATVDWLHALHRRERLGLIVQRNDLGLTERTLTLTARTLGIPTLYLPHGQPAATMQEVGVQADLACTFGTRMTDWYRAHGTPAARLMATGCPAWDRYANPEADGREGADPYERLGLSPEQPIVLLGLTWRGWLTAYDAVNQDWPWAYAHAALAALQAINAGRPESQACQAIVKLHPGATPGDVDRAAGLVEEYRVPASLVNGYVEPWHLAASNVVLCCESNLGIEAILAGKPVLNLRFDAIPFDPRGRIFGNGQAVVTATCAEDVAPLLRQCLWDVALHRQLAAERPAAIAALAGPQDGHATQRVIEGVGVFAGGARS